MLAENRRFGNLCALEGFPRGKTKLHHLLALQFRMSLCTREMLKRGCRVLKRGSRLSNLANETGDNSMQPQDPPNSDSTRHESATPGTPTVISGAIPPATASRLGLYLRELQHFSRSGFETIKSNALGKRLGLSDSQIRRDLALFGEFGKRGVGYNVEGLVAALRRALGTDGQWNTVLIGLGNLGRALVHYKGFSSQGFALQAIFEADPQMVGKKINGVEVFAIERLESLLPTLDVQMAILAVPADVAPRLAQRLSDLGVAGILNFAPVSLSNTSGIVAINVDLAVELQRLAFAVVNSERTS